MLGGFDGAYPTGNGGRTNVRGNPLKHPKNPKFPVPNPITKVNWFTGAVSTNEGKRKNTVDKGKREW